MQKFIISLVFIVQCFWSSFCTADDGEFVVKPVNDNVSVTYSNHGGNVGLYKTSAGIIVVDALTAELNNKLVEAVQKFSSGNVKYLINTHWHWDHVGGNEGIAKLGATIIAHNKLRDRMTAQQVSKYFKTTIAPYPSAALPMITFDDEMELHVGNNNILIKHFPAAHTDGDSVVVFKNLNIIQTGDIFISNGYPFFDLETEGSVQGMIKAVKWILSQANDGTVIIPGHGHITHKRDLEEYLSMFVSLSDKVKKLKKQGMSLEQIKETSPTKNYDDRWNKGYTKNNAFLSLIFNDK